MNIDKDKVLDAIRDEWVREFGLLPDLSNEMRDKYYFMVGFVSSAIERAEEK